MVFEVLGVLVNDVKARVSIFDSIRKAYLYTFMGQYQELKELDEVNKKMIRIYYESRKKEKIDDEKIAKAQDIEIDEDSEEFKENLMRLYINLLNSDFYMISFMIAAINDIYRDKINSNYFKVMDENTQIIIDTLKSVATDSVDDVDGEIYAYMATVCKKHCYLEELLKTIFHVKSISDQNIMWILNNIVGKDKIREFILQQPESIVERKNVVNELIKCGYTTEEELIKSVDRGEILKYYENRENSELLKYLDKIEIIKLYANKKINDAAFAKYIKMEDILLAKMDKDSKMKILKLMHKRNIQHGSNSKLIWEFFEKSYFSFDEVQSLLKMNYIHTKTIIKYYYADEQRKIAAELDVIPGIADNKIIEFFTPSLVIEELGKSLSDIELKFYCKDLKRIYMENGLNLENEVVNFVQASTEGSADSKACDKLLYLYTIGFLSETTLAKANIPEKKFVEYYYDNKKSESTLINFYNNGLISQDAIIEIFEDDFEEKAIDYINKGMNASVISGLYSTIELIKMTRYGVISYEDLAMVKDDIKTGLGKKSEKEKTLLNMYLSQDLTYSELYDMVNAGVISKEEADEIDDHYNLGLDVEKLKGKGVSGKPIDYLFKPQPVSVSQSNKTHKPKKQVSSDSIGIDNSLIKEFYKRLGAKDIIKINAEKCPVFDGYVIIPIIEKKIGFLEGIDGRTYILPLKIILEQINNPGSEMDLIGTATSRNTFNGNQKYVRGTNHTKNWVINTINKAAELSPNITKGDLKAFKTDNEDLILEVQLSYEDRKSQKSH